MKILKNTPKNMKIRVSSLAISFIASLALFVVSGHASNGTLDPSFGSGGIVETRLGGPFAQLYDMTIQSDGKIVVVASGSQIARFTLSGALDTTFAGDGVTNPGLCEARAAQALPNGKIIFGGIYFIQNNVHLCIGRLNADGSPDTTLDGDGFALTTMGIESQASSIDGLPGGKILASGWTSLLSTSNRDYAMIQFNADGSLDTGFGTGGRVATELGSNEFSYASAIQPDGKILLAGDFFESLSGQSMGAIVRYNTDGAIDTGFGTNGKVFRSAAQFGKIDDIVVQADGKIVVVGYGMVPGRYNANGTLDTNFTSPAWVNTTATALQPNGKILVSGGTVPESTFLARYNQDATLDPTFGTGGVVMNTGGISSNLVFVTRLLVAPDGKIVLGGTHNDSGFEIVLARYFGAPGPLDFDADGKTDIAIYRPSAGQWWITKSSNGENNVFTFGVSTDKIVPGDYTGDSKTDVAVWRPSTGVWYILRSEDYSFYAFPFGLDGDIPYAADFDGDLKADAAIFRPSNGTWYIFNSTGGYTTMPFGINGDTPVAADYDGDGKDDIAIYRSSTDTWWVNKSSGGVFSFTFPDQIGGEKVVTGDFTGDGKAEFGLCQVSGGFAFVRSEDYFTRFGYGVGTGNPNEIPAPGDFDGDGIMDGAMYQTASGTWRIRLSTTGTIVTTNYGISTDKPVPSAFVPN